MKSIYKKDLIDVWRDRKTLLLSIILPLVIVIVSVMIQNTSGDLEMKVVYDESVPENVVNIIAEEYASLEYSDQMEEDLMQDKADIGLQADDNTLIFYGNVDESNIQDEITNLELIMTQNTLQDIEQGTNSHYLKTEVANLDQESGSIGNLLMNILIMSVLFGAFPASVSLFAEEKEQRTMEALLMAPKSRFRILSSKFLVILTMGLISGCIAIFGGIILTFFIDTDGSNIVIGDGLTAQMIGLMLNTVLFAINAVTLLMLVSIMSGSFKEAQNYMMATMILLFIGPGIMSTLTPANIPMWIFFVPSLNNNAFMQVIFSSSPGFYMPLLLTTVSSLLLFITLFFICYRMFNDDKKALGDN